MRPVVAISRSTMSFCFGTCCQSGGQSKTNHLIVAGDENSLCESRRSILTIVHFGVHLAVSQWASFASTKFRLLFAFISFFYFISTLLYSFFKREYVSGKFLVKLVDLKGLLFW